MTTCIACNGAGYYLVRYWTTGYGQHEDRRDCVFCDGTGQIDADEQDAVTAAIHASWNPVKED